MYDDVRPTATLFLLTGPWASGKSTLVPLLARLLPEVVVLEWDTLLPGLSRACGTDAHADASTWGGPVPAGDRSPEQLATAVASWVRAGRVR
jgi:energy-coupling factor transporter ATP-binding protein EcfA2